jgi:hypothetical protein
MRRAWWPHHALRIPAQGVPHNHDLPSSSAKKNYVGDRIFSQNAVVDKPGYNVPVSITVGDEATSIASQ